MREIKFRAWDSGHKHMISWEDLNTYDKDGHTCFLDILDGTYSEIIPMQYTGLKDKNGVDIYEKDILLIRVHVMAGYDYNGNDLMEEETVISEMVFKDGLFGVKLPPWDCDHIALCELGGDDDYEVLGNIYENPEHLMSER